MGPDALLKKIGKKQRHRTGYAADTSLMHTSTAAATFVLCEDHMATLASASQFALDGEDSLPAAVRSRLSSMQPNPCKRAMPAHVSKEVSSAARGILSSVLMCLIDVATVQDEKRLWEAAETAEFVRNHPATSSEVRQLCSDLKVIGRSEFKQLLRWRMKVRSDILKAEAAARKTAAAEVRSFLMYATSQSCLQEVCHQGRVLRLSRLERHRTVEAVQQKRRRKSRRRSSGCWRKWSGCAARWTAHERSAARSGAS